MNNERWERRLNGANPININEMKLNLNDRTGETFPLPHSVKNDVKSIVRKCVEECRNEYKDKIKEDVYFERGFLFAISELYSRLSKAIENELK